RVKRVVPEYRRDEKDKQHEKEHGARDEQAKFFQTAFEFGFRRMCRKMRGDAAELRRTSCRRDTRDSSPTYHRRSQKHARGVIARRCIFFNRDRFAGERGFVHMQIARRNKLRVRWNKVARAELNYIIPYELTSGQLDPIAIAQYRRGGRDLGAQAFHRPLRAKRLHKIEHDAQDDDRGDNERVDEIADQREDERGGEQNQNEGIGEKEKKFDKR